MTRARYCARPFPLLALGSLLTLARSHRFYSPPPMGPAQNEKRTRAPNKWQLLHNYVDTSVTIAQSLSLHAHWKSLRVGDGLSAKRQPATRKPREFAPSELDDSSDAESTADCDDDASEYEPSDDEDEDCSPLPRRAHSPTRPPLTELVYS